MAVNRRCEGLLVCVTVVDRVMAYWGYRVTYCVMTYWEWRVTDGVRAYCEWRVTDGLKT